MSLPLRQELPLAETWDLSLLYQDQAASGRDLGFKSLVSRPGGL